MKVKLNGKYTDISGNGVDLLSFVKEEVNQHHNRIVVQLNGKIVPKTEWECTFIKDNDTINILYMVGGGTY